MSEENKVDTPVVEEGKTETVVAEPSVPELSPVEQQAQEQGWVPLEDWKASGRDENEWRPAKEFVERGELYKSIHSTKRELKQTQAALTALQKHHQYVYEKSYQQAIKDLRDAKRQAIRNEDFQKLEEIEDKMEQVQTEFQRDAQQFAVTNAATQASTNVAPEFQAWVDRNGWYLTDSALRDEAEAAGFLYLNKGGTKDGLLAHVETTIKRKFPEKFGVKRAAPNAVAGVDRTAAKKTTKDNFELTSDERAIMDTFVKQGIMSEADYIKELKKAR